MNRTILEACLPAFLALLVLALLMWLTVRISGARWNWRRLRELNRCQDGGVQTLAFVLTLPMFIIFLQTIIQISQLMLGIMGVHYSAYAAARAAVVWIPADVAGGYIPEPPNQVAGWGYAEDDDTITIAPSLDSEKYQRIRLAAVLGIAPFCPSRELTREAGHVQFQHSPAVMEAIASTQTIYHSLVPNDTNTVIDDRIARKILWADEATAVILEWRDARNANGRNTLVSPAYNPRYHPNPDVIWQPYEAGWQDPVTVHVVHRFALLPGPGRWLAQQLVMSDRLPARVRGYIDDAHFDQTQGNPRTVVIPASATLVNEGLKPTFTYDHGVQNSSFN